MNTKPRELVTISTHLYQNMVDFLDHNQTEQHKEPNTGDWGILAFQAFASRPEDPLGYVLRYDNSTCQTELPAGRYIQIGYQGLYFDSISSTLPLEPTSFEEIVPMAEAIYQSLVKAGWQTKRYKPKVTQQSIAEYLGGLPRHFYADLYGCGHEKFQAYITIKHYNSLPSGPSIPPVAGKPLPADYPDRYIITVGFLTRSPVDDELYALRDARREAVAGDKRKNIGLQIWLDDPYWKPEGWQGEFIK